MPDINKAYVFSQPYTLRLQEKFRDPTNTYTNWSDLDLQDIRVSIREFYRSEQKGKCAYCNQSISLYSANNCNVEHIVPKSKYLQFIAEPKNLCVICVDCNTIKRDQEVMNEVPDVTARKMIKRYPTKSESFKLLHPHFDCFDDHLIESNGYYINKTKKGAYTIYACNLNRKIEKFGYENSDLDEVELIEMMDSFKSETDFLKRSRTLKKIQKAMIFI